MFNASYEQTALIYRPDTPLDFATMARRPLPPPHLVDRLKAGEPVAIRRYSDDAIVQWWPDGFVTVVQVDGVELHFWSKPTLLDAIHYSGQTARWGRGFFKFNGDGSVYGHCFRSNYYWGPDLDDTNPELGDTMISEQGENGNWIFVDDYKDEDDTDTYEMCHCRGCSSWY